MAPMASVTPPATVQAAVHQQSKSSRHGGTSWKLYTVQPGDTLSSLAARFDTSISILTARNHLASSGRICVGQHMAVPATSPGKKPAKGEHNATSKAKKHHATRTHHKTRSASHTSHRGAKHSSSAKRKAAKSPTRSYEHQTVRAGDTLWGLARAHHTTVAALVKANHLSPGGLVVAGTTLRVPVKEAGHAPAPAQHSKKKTTSHHPKKRHHLTKAERTFAGWTYPEKVVRSAHATRSFLAERPAPTRSETRALIVRTAHRYGVDPKLALGIAWQESGWNQRAVSIAGAVGVMQVMPQSGHWASDLVDHKLNILDARDNVTAGVVILRYLTGNADDLNQAIGGYYQGLGGVQSRGMLPDTKSYVHNVRAHMVRF